MKKPSFFSSPPTSRRGVALISVLAIVVLITGLVVAFLVRAGNEKIATSHYDATSTSRVLTDTVVNLVQATISEATTVQADAGLKTAWASQPGAIRVYSEAGVLQKIYRLYSAPSLVSTTATASILANDLPAPAEDWQSLPSKWVDLNAPVLVSGVSGSTDKFLSYPILDPRDPSITGPIAVTAPVQTTKIPGFSIDPTKKPASPVNQPAPMPVQWLYVLQDGQISAPIMQPSGAAKITGAGSSNPIVGRIAFWTDDETAKVNINTASGSLSKRNGVNLPSPWETPKFKMWEERMLFSENQPVKAEYQRYPGHPATTDLYGILNGLNVTMTGYPAVMANYSTSPQPIPQTTASSFYKILPRYSDDNSSQGGSAFTTLKTTTVVEINGGNPKRDRLYTSIGELLYNPQRNPNGLSRQQIESGSFFLTAHSRAPEVTLFGTPRVAMWPINSVDSSTTRTAFDRLIAFCSTIVGAGNTKYPYYIQRSDARSSKNDYDNIPRNQALFRYIKNLTGKEIPGFGGSFKAKYSVSNESDQIVMEMFDYIRSLNTYDHSLPSSNATYKRFTTNPTGLSGGKSQVTPLKISDGGVTTRALGRIQTLSEIGIVIICTAEGSSTSHLNKVTGNPQIAYATPELISGKQVSPMKGSANDPAYASNLPEAQYLRDNTGTNGNIVGWDPINKTLVAGDELTPPPASKPFPANPTLTPTGDYGATPLVALAPGEKKLQAALLFEVACPMMGFDSLDTSTAPSWQLEVSNIQNVRIDGQTPFPSRTTTGDTVGPNMNGNGAITSMSTRVNTIQGTGGIQGFRYLMLKYATNSTSSWNARYNGWSGTSPYSNINSPYRYVSNPFTVAASTTGLSFSGDFKVELKVPTSATATETYQTFNVDFPSPTNALPIPTLPVVGLRTGNTTDTQVWGSNFTIPADWWGFDNRIAWAVIKGSLESTNTTSPVQTMGAVIRGDAAISGTWDYIYRDKVSQPSFTSQPSSSDVVRTLVAKDGDYRLTAALETVNANGSADFVKGPGYDSGTVRIGNLFRDQSSSLGTAGSDQGGKLVKGVTYSWSWVPKVPSTLSEDKMKTWDWDNGLPGEKDGAHAGKADEGNTYRPDSSTSPYYNGETQVTNDISSYFTANRIVNSAVTFGSLPTGVKEGITWRTLLFRPQKTTGTADAGRPFDPTIGPKDHLFLDLFNMPVVEPYAISEPFSTAGKINMNYQIVPFTYITRSTGVQAVLSSELIPRVHRVAAANKDPYDQNTWYKGRAGSISETLPGGAPPLARLPLNMSETNGTLRQFREKFDSWDLFKSASEICDIYLVPNDTANPSRYNWTTNDLADAGWYGLDFAMVGDNARERPYGNLYPRLTTKSNTFTVHYKVQSLKNPLGSKVDEWNESRGTITGEFRGSTTLERYLNPNNSKIPDYATNFNVPSIDKFYQWRIVSNTAFSP